jgi:uncharacterized Rmd1/YagE family protein
MVSKCQSVKVSFSIFIKSGAGKREKVIKYNIIILIIYINILIYIIKFFSPLGGDLETQNDTLTL